MNNQLYISDNGGRRSGIERRRFTYTNFFPERRSGKDRRSGIDRRSQRYSDKDGIERRNLT